MSKVEMMDIINENDEVIGTAERSKIQAEGLKYRYVVIWVISSDGDLAVQWRTHTKKRGPRLFDCSVGGGVLAGESYEQAAIREAKEELGLDINPEHINLIDVLDDSIANAKGAFFVIEHDGPYENWEEEADALDFLSFDELSYMVERFPYLLTEGLKLTYAHYLALSLEAEKAAEEENAENETENVVIN